MTTYKQAMDKMEIATKATATMRDAVQEALQAMVMHVAEHNDASLVINQGKDWVQSLNGINGAAVVEYLVRFAGVRVEGQNFKNHKAKDADVAGAMACKWYDLKKDNPFAGFDLASKLGTLLKQIENAMQEEDQSKVYIAPKLVGELQAMQGMAAKFSSAQKEAQKREGESLDGAPTPVLNDIDPLANIAQA